MPDDDRKRMLQGLANRERARYAIGRLSALPPDGTHLKRILRLHWEDEKGVGDRDEIDLRDGFDNELQWLTLLELAAETGYLTKADIESELSSSTRSLLMTPAAGRFVDAYLYFGIRFLAVRMAIARAFPSEQIRAKESFWTESKPEQSNVWPMGLPAPPPLFNVDGFVEEFIQLDQQLRARSEVSTAIQFLDDYVSYGGEQPDYLLWLRGLLWPRERDQEMKFRTLSQGLLAWVEEKARFYADLQSDALRARFGVYDLYWLAKLLGAEVSSDGAVIYHDRFWLLEFREFPQTAGVGPLKSSRNRKRACV